MGEDDRVIILEQLGYDTPATPGRPAVASRFQSSRASME